MLFLLLAFQTAQLCDYMPPHQCVAVSEKQKIAIARAFKRRWIDGHSLGAIPMATLGDWKIIGNEYVLRGSDWNHLYPLTKEARRMIALHLLRASRRRMKAGTIKGQP